MSLLSLKVVSPEKVIFSEIGFESVTLPTESGEITVLPAHIPLVSKVVHGEIIARAKGKNESLVTTSGFLKVSENGEILVLSDYAVRSQDIEVARVEAAKKKAQEAMKEKVSGQELAVAEADLRRTLLELKVSQKRRAVNRGV